jgi:uncharacterized SAM-binding protein YcdF (DUF218 family)
MFFVASKIFEFFAAPSHIWLFATAFGVALCFSRYLRFGRWIAVLGVAALLAMSFGPVGHFLAMPLETRFPAPPSDLPAPDGIIVLGGSVNEILSGIRGQIVFEEAAERLTAPIELMRRCPNARLVFTGGSAALRGSPLTEARTVERFWRDMGLSEGLGEREIVYEGRSRNTHENAVFTRDLVQPKAGERWLLVTSAMHMPRSVGIFRRAGFSVIPYPVDFRTSGDLWRWSMARRAPQALRTVDFAAHEWLGLVIYRLTGKTNAFFPAP